MGSSQNSCGKANHFSKILVLTNGVVIDTAAMLSPVSQRLPDVYSGRRAGINFPSSAVASKPQERVTGYQISSINMAKIVFANV